MIYPKALENFPYDLDFFTFFNLGSLAIPTTIQEFFGLSLQGPQVGTE